MILYLDTSALVKRYFREPYSDEVISRWKEATDIVISSVAYADTIASFFRKKREGHLKDSMVQRIIEAFRLDWKSFIRIEVNDQLNVFLEGILKKYYLRGLDAIHLASAVLLQESIQEKIIFRCFDQGLSRAAHQEGLQIFPSI